MKNLWRGLSAIVGLIIALPAQAQITEADLRAHIDVLASDEFEGRMPGTAGETRTLVYIANALAGAGWQSGTNDGAHPWFAPVPLVIRSTAAQTVQFSAGGRMLTLPPDGFILRSNRAANSVQDGPLVFAGYGVDAGGNALPGVAGKTAVIWSRDPNVDDGTKADIETRREKLFAAGASAVLAINAADGADFEAVKARFSQRGMRLASRDKMQPLEGLLSRSYADKLMKLAGYNVAKLRALSDSADFAPVDLPLTANLSVEMYVLPFASHNVIGKLPGKSPGSGAVLLLGHWDHLGLCEPEGAEDRICNGAVDNASGISLLIEVAKQLAAGPQLDRDVYILATTAEEQGLLGAYAFAEKPPLPLDRIVVALNVDTIAIAAAGAKVAVIGRGETRLDADVEEIIKEQGLMVDDSDTSNAYIRRQDGWALAEKGVPAFMINSSFSNAQVLNAFIGSVYHRHDDAAGPALELGGAAQDANLHVALARYFGDAAKYIPAPPSE